jgi:prevent-host-death family protein
VEETVTRTITVAELQGQASEYIDQAAGQHEPIIIESDGQPRAALISIDACAELQRLRQEEVRRRTWAAPLIRQLIERDGLSEEAAYAQVQQARYRLLHALAELDAANPDLEPDTVEELVGKDIRRFVPA